MNFTWSPEQEPAPHRITPAGWLRAVLRGLILVVILLVGVLATALLRLIEAPLYGLHRPWTPHITVVVCKLSLAVVGLRRELRGKPMTEPGAVVSNHASWLDIFSLNAHKRVYFVSKAEVANWPGIGLLAKITGTVFIARDPKQARAQTELFQARLKAGHKLLFFPEGTSTDGLRVLPFKTTLFQAFFNEELRDLLHVQPVTLIYRAPEGEEARFYGWWGDMEFGPHLLKTIAAGRQGSVTVVYHPPVKVADFPDRKALAAHVEAAVRAGMPAERQVTEG